jgi:hypothetical protein
MIMRIPTLIQRDSRNACQISVLLNGMDGNKIVNTSVQNELKAMVTDWHVRMGRKKQRPGLMKSG